jgi:hypothetical protein
MTDQRQPADKAAGKTPDQAAGGADKSTPVQGASRTDGGNADRGGNGGGRARDRNGTGLQANQTLTLRFERLEKALHGDQVRPDRRALNWSGLDDTSVAFDSIVEILNAAIPPERPTTALPDHAATQQGS